MLKTRSEQRGIPLSEATGDGERLVAGAELPLDGEPDLDDTADVVDSNESRLVGGVDETLGVHVEDGRASTAGRPRLNTRLGDQVEVVIVFALELDLVGDLVARVLAEVEDVLADAGNALGDLSEAVHVGIEDGELEARIEFHVDGELAVLSPVAGLGARASLNHVLREGGLEDGAGGIDLDVGRARGAAAPKEADTVDLDLTRALLVLTGLQNGWGSGSEAEEASDSGEDLHFDGE